MKINYGSSGDVRTNLGSPTETEVSANLLDLARRKATDLVNGYLEVAFPTNVPWGASGDTPVLINSITDDIACYFIKRNTHKGIMPLSDEVKEEFWEKPVQMLKDIQSGKMQLPELTAAVGDSVEANRGSYTPIFDVDKVDFSKIDSDLQDVINDARD